MITKFEIIKWFSVFIAVFFIDVIWTLYIRSISQGKAIRASIMSAAVYALSVFSFVNVVENFMLLIPAALGAFFGTYFTVRWDSKNV